MPTKVATCRHVFVKLPIITFNRNPHSGSQVVTCGQTGMAKPTGVFLRKRLKIIALYDILHSLDVAFLRN
jgi:hypothetical protein